MQSALKSRYLLYFNCSEYAAIPFVSNSCSFKKNSNNLLIKKYVHIYEIFRRFWSISSKKHTTQNSKKAKSGRIFQYRFLEI